MRRVVLVHGLVIGIVSLLLFGTQAVAGNDPAEEVLARNGLKRVGSLYVLDVEAQVQAKLKQARQMSRRWDEARLERASFMTAKEHQELVREITQRISRLRGELAAVNRQMGRVPRSRGRRLNAYPQADQGQFAAYRDELNLAIGQQSDHLNQLRSRPPDPKRSQKLDGEVASRRAEYDHAVSELRRLVETGKEKYASLAKNDEVRRAIHSQAGVVKPSPRLGPSREFQVTAKLVERLEKLPPEPVEPPASEPAKARKKGKASR